MMQIFLAVTVAVQNVYRRYTVLVATRLEIDTQLLMDVILAHVQNQVLLAQNVLVH
jgi:hypothetical protein